MYLETFSEYERESAVNYTGTPKRVPALAYYALAINGEAGELAEKVKKIYRDHDGFMSAEDLYAIIDEGGDILWYLARLCGECGISLDSLARRNIVKLQGRQQRGTIQGSGDKR